MRINKILFENFMPYHGKNLLELSTPSSNPVILILGENGHGKTSIHHAIRWCLFGKTKPLKSDELIPPYKLLNWKSRTDFENYDERNPQYREVHFAVEIEFEHLGKKFELKRKQTFKGSDRRGIEDVSLRVDDGNYVSGSRIQEVVESVLSEDLSQFFLFDGEVLDRFEEMRTQDQQAKFVKQQIESTLGIPRIKQVALWVDQKVDQQMKILRKSESQSKRVTELQEKILRDEELKRSKDSERIALVENLNKNRIELEKLKSILGDYESIKADLDRERDLRTDIKNDEKLLVEFLNNLKSQNKVLFWAPVASKMLVIAAKQREIEPTVKKLLEERDILTSRASLLTMFMTQNHCPVCGSTGNSASDENHSKLRSIQDEISEINRVLISQDPVYLADYEDLLAKLGFSEASYTEMKTTHKKITRLKESIARKKMELSSLIERLPVTNMEVSQRDNLSRYESLTRRIAQDEILLGDLDKEIESLQQSLLANRAQIVKNQTITSKPAKAMSFYSHLHGLLVRTIEIYAQNVRSHVEREASTVFSQIISEKEFESLQINSMFGMEIVKIDKSLVSLRSEGQAHIAAISLVAGLLKTAIKDGFILMDTPFGRLDMTHRENICHWIVDSGLQVALFVHSGEFRTEEHMHLLNGKVGRQYQIQRLDSNRSQFKELI